MYQIGNLKRNHGAHFGEECGEPYKLRMGMAIDTVSSRFIILH